jgi:hypothetical protein
MQKVYDCLSKCKSWADDPTEFEDFKLQTFKPKVVDIAKSHADSPSASDDGKCIASSFVKLTDQANLAIAFFGAIKNLEINETTDGVQVSR